jgi:hypothetical protein
MKIYLLVIAIIILIVAELGFVAPVLFSAESTELVLFGVITLVAFVPTMYYLVRKIVFLIKKNTETEKTNNV